MKTRTKIKTEIKDIKGKVKLEPREIVLTTPRWTYLETIKAIDETKTFFEKELNTRLGLTKVPSPLFLKTSSGLQDQLDGGQEAVSFVKGSERFEIAHSLAKWKREALARYRFPIHTGLCTDMKAIRKEEVVDSTHSLFVEQWDWEKTITYQDRSISYLKQTVGSIYKAIKETAQYLKSLYPFLTLELPDRVYFITAQELEDLYPTYTAEEREQLIGREKQVVFIIGIGDKLKLGKPHDVRSPDYDDWSLNGDLLIFDKELDKTIEISSMGIRVDEISLKSQLIKSDCLDRIKLPYHQKVLKKELPYTIGGGIGQSRILMLLLEKHHIAEIQASSWEDKTYEELKHLQIL